MCGGTAGDIIKGAQKEADKAVKGVQSAADAAIGRGSQSSGGKTSGWAVETLSSQDLYDAIQPNLDQDFTKGNMADVQEAFVDAGSAVQAQVIESGGAGQQALIDAASATQTNAIVLGTNLTGGQSNPALEQGASNITKETEAAINIETKGLESSIQTEVKGYEATADKEVKGLEASLATEVKGIEQIPTDIANWNICLLYTSPSPRD